MDKLWSSAVSILVFTVILMTTSIQRIESLSCYNCTGDMTTEAGRACANLQTLTRMDVNSGYCVIRTYVEGNKPFITREAKALPTPITPGCTVDVLGRGGECSCTEQDCNYAKVKIPMLTCYECTTINMISSGCGEGTEWKSGSLYVQQTAGCHACIKHIRPDGGVVRECSRSLYSKSKCDYETRGTTCYCTGDLCNTAAYLSVPQASIVASIILASLARWLL